MTTTMRWAEVDSDNEEEIARQAELKAKKLEEELKKKAEEEKEEEEQKDEFDEDGNLIIKGPTKKQLGPSVSLRKLKLPLGQSENASGLKRFLMARPRSRSRVQVVESVKLGTKTCTKCYRALHQPDLEELKRIEAERKAEAEAKLAEDARIKAEKEEARKLRRGPE